MARASLVRSSLAWLHALQQMYRMMASGCRQSPGRHTAEHEVARSWTERSRPRGHRPSGQEHERARFFAKRRLGANLRTGFRQVPLRWYEKYAAGTGLGPTGSTTKRIR